MKKRLLISISSHGFGHFSMTVPIIRDLIEQDNFEIILRTQIPEYLIKSRIPYPLTVVRESSDFGMTMNSSLDVDKESSWKSYETLHDNWDATVSAEVQKLKQIKPDLILANVPYLTLAAASDIRIPALAYCSLNWAHITLDYFKPLPKFRETIFPQMLTAYNSAEAFISPAPSMPMPGLTNIHSVGPVCTIGNNRKSEIIQKLGLSTRTRLVLVSPGGVATPIPVESWPEVKDIVWVLAWSQPTTRSDLISIDTLDIPFPDWTASVDCLVTKPGYGTVSESVCLGKPAIYVRRGDWAEEPGIVDWWEVNGNVKEVSRTQFFAGDFIDELEALLDNPPSSPQKPVGIKQTLDIINKIR